MNNESLKQFIEDNLRDGEGYAGIILGKDGNPSHHLVLLPGMSPNRLDFDEATEWAASAGGILPKWQELAIIVANVRRVKPYIYWSSTLFNCNSQAGVVSASTGKMSLKSLSHIAFCIAIRRIYL